MTKNIIITFIFILFLQMITACTSDEWTIPVEECEINQQIDCNVSLIDIQNQIREKCSQLSDDCYLSKISWDLEIANGKEFVQNGVLTFTFCKPLKQERYELFDVTVDINLSKIDTVKKYGNSQIGTYGVLQEIGLDKTLVDWTDNIILDSDCLSIMERVSEFKINLEFIESRVMLSIFSNEVSGAILRKTL